MLFKNILNNGIIISSYFYGDGGRIMEIVISGYNHTGEGIGRIDGKVIFVSKAVPGDVVRIRDLEDFKTYCRSNTYDIVVGSKDRIAVECPYYSTCGGCQLMGISYLKQLNYKRDKVKDILKKYGDIDIDLDIVLSDKIYGYRNKITLQVNDGVIGLYKYNSNELLEIDNCMLVSDSVNQLIRLIKNKLNLECITKIMIREYDGNLMVQFIGDIDKEFVIEVLGDKVSIIYINDLLVYGEKSLEIRLGDYKYKVSPYSFFQVNYSQAEILYDKVKEYLGCDNNKVLDLYCGTGSIGIYVSSCCREVLGIEINESSVRDALENIKLNGVGNVKVIKGDVGKVFKALEKYDAIIIDPPRSGLDKRTKRTLLELKSEKIIYVSCDPITLARDLKVLGECYEIEDMVLVDMFPNTYHVESVVLLRLK